MGSERTLVSRRNFLRSSSAVFCAAAGVGTYTWRIEPRWLQFVRRPLQIRGLPSSLAGRTLVQISDVHIGNQVDDDYVIEAFRQVSDLRPDLVFFTGDFISHHAGVFEQMVSVYRHFPIGRLATLAILGNHDYGERWSHPEIALRVVETVTPFGVTVLRNEVHEVEGLQVLGLDDFWAGRFDPSNAMARLAPSAPGIVLSHNPDTVDLPVWGKYDGWILSGHTHGGQCKPPFLPPPLLPVRNRRYTAGEFALDGNRRLYISRGVGHLLHVRFNVRPEITIHELQRA
jgi:predicted MPP superfamily phosphohydrolase